MMFGILIVATDPVAASKRWTLWSLTWSDALRIGGLGRSELDFDTLSCVAFAEASRDFDDLDIQNAMPARKIRVGTPRIIPAKALSVSCQAAMIRVQGDRQIFGHFKMLESHALDVSGGL